MIWFWLWRRRPGWHPFVFMLAVGTFVVALVHLDVFPMVMSALLIVWTLRAGTRG